jgi:hypothetical protein
VKIMGVRGRGGGEARWVHRGSELGPEVGRSGGGLWYPIAVAQEGEGEARAAARQGPHLMGKCVCVCVYV